MKRKILQISFFIIAVAFISLGIILEQQNDVITKAINICLECIGIG